MTDTVVLRGAFARLSVRFRSSTIPGRGVRRKGERTGVDAGVRHVLEASGGEGVPRWRVIVFPHPRRHPSRLLDNAAGRGGVVGSILFPPHDANGEGDRDGEDVSW